VKSSSPNAASTWVVFLYPHMLLRRTFLHSASIILAVHFSCCVIAVFVFRKPLFINSTLLYLCMLCQYPIIYSIKYYLQFHVTTVGLGTYYSHMGWGHTHTGVGSFVKYPGIRNAPKPAMFQNSWIQPVVLMFLQLSQLHQTFLMVYPWIMYFDWYELTHTPSFLRMSSYLLILLFLSVF
jgi:hypothetical protein